MSGSLLHFQNGVPIDDLHLKPNQRERLARVQHVYWQWVRNPWLDTYQMFRQLAKGHYASPSSETHAAQHDNRLFEFVRDNVAPPSRKTAEAKVRAVADRLMQNGMATDNGKDMAEGAKIAIKLDRLDQPESEQMELSKAVFLPPVVTTSAHEVDDTKEDMSDSQSLAIMNKYKAYIDEKRVMIDDRVAVMEAARGTEEAQDTDYTEVTE